MLLGVLGWVFIRIFFVFPLLLASVSSHETIQWYQSNLVCIKIGLMLRVLSFWYHCFQIENEIFGMKRFRSSIVLEVYGHEMI